MSTIEQIKYEGMREDLTKELTEELTGKLTEELTVKLTEELTEELTGKGIQTLILSNLEERIPRERILANLQKYYNLTEEKARQYYEKFAAEIRG